MALKFLPGFRVTTLAPVPPRRRLRLSLRFVLLAVLSLACAGLTGCSVSGLKGRKCAVVFLVDGHQVRPTYKQFQEVDKALGPSMEQKGYVLIHDLHEAEFLAKVEVVPNQNDPSRTNLVLRDVVANDLVRVDDARFSPSIIESMREHNEAFRGFTRPGD